MENKENKARNLFQKLFSYRLRIDRNGKLAGRVRARRSKVAAVRRLGQSSAPEPLMANIL